MQYSGYKPLGSKLKSFHTEHAERCLSFSCPSGSHAFYLNRYKTRELLGFINGINIMPFA